MNVRSFDIPFLIPGAGNVFRDLGETDADLRQAKLARFTLDRLIRMVQALDPGASVSVRVEAGGAADA